MSRRKRAKQANQPGRAMPTSIQAQRGQPVSKKKVKRVKAKRKDIVLLGHSPMRHISGMVMQVVEVLDKDRLVCEALMPEDNDFEGFQMVVFTSPPRGKTKNGSLRRDWLPWAERIINVRERVVYKEVPVRPKRVVTSHEELQTVLADGADEEHVVLQLPTQNSHVTPIP